MSMQRMKLEIKDISEEGTFTGKLSVYGVLDQVGDIVERGAFTKTIKERGSEVPLLWQHRSDVPIGMLVLEDQLDALWVKGRLLMELEEAKKAYLLIKARIVKGLSIGFETVKDSIEGGVRHLKECRLYEGSIVTFPACEAALITSVKNADGTERKDFSEELMREQLWAAYSLMMSALDSSLCDVRWSGTLSSDEIQSASGLMIDQFKDAYMTYLPAYLAMTTDLFNGMNTLARADVERKAIKAGARHSAATRAKIEDAIQTLSALLEEAGSSTSEPEAAKAAPTEPVVDHSAVSSKIAELKELYGTRKAA